MTQDNNDLDILDDIGDLYTSNMRAHYKGKTSLGYVLMGATGVLAAGATDAVMMPVMKHLRKEQKQEKLQQLKKQITSYKAQQKIKSDTTISLPKRITTDPGFPIGFPTKATVAIQTLIDPVQKKFDTVNAKPEFGQSEIMSLIFISLVAGMVTSGALLHIQKATDFFANAGDALDKKIFPKPPKSNTLVKPPRMRGSK